MKKLGYLSLILLYQLVVLQCQNYENDFVKLDHICVQKQEVSISEFKAFKTSNNYISDFDKHRTGYIYSFQEEQWIPKLFGNTWVEYQKFKNENLPATMVSYADACAYCDWIGGRLPSAQEWETFKGKEVVLGNTWEGIFPINDKGKDGFKAEMSPVGVTLPNKYRLFDIYGNVWEWVQKEGYTTMVKGGSYLSDLKNCGDEEKAPSLRLPENRIQIDVGFRCVLDNC